MRKNRGREFEDLVQKTINSGAIVWDKGDLKTDDYLIECKYTDKKSFRITAKILEKLWDEAFSSNKLPRLIVGISRNDKELFIINCNVEIKRR